MNISIDQQALKAALTPITRVVPSKTTSLPILSHVLIDARAGEIRIAGTDLVTSVEMTVPGDVEAAGAKAVEAAMLASLVAGLPTGTIRIAAGDLDQVTVTCARNRSVLRAIDPEDFPELPDAAATTPLVTMAADDLARMIGLVGIAAATDPSRVVLTGMLVRVRGGELVLACADGFQAAVAARDTGEDSDVSAIVPSTSMRELARLLRGREDEITIGVTERGSHVVASVGTMTWTGRIIDGTYPDVWQIIPREFATRTTVGRDVLAGSLRRAMLFAKTSPDKKVTGTVAFGVQPGDDDLTPGTLRVQGRDISGAETVDVLDVACEGDGIDILFGGDYLVDALAAMDSAQVTLSTNGPRMPAVLRMPGDDRYTYVVMPKIVEALL